MLKASTWWKVILRASLTDKKKKFKLVIRREHFPAERTPFNFSHQGRYFRTFAPPSKASSDCDGGAEQT